MVALDLVIDVMVEIIQAVNHWQTGTLLSPFRWQRVFSLPPTQHGIQPKVIRPVPPAQHDESKRNGSQRFG